MKLLVSFIQQVFSGSLPNTELIVRCPPDVAYSENAVSLFGIIPSGNLTVLLDPFT